MEKQELKKLRDDLIERLEILRENNNTSKWYIVNFDNKTGLPLRDKEVKAICEIIENELKDCEAEEIN